jgi:restriction system protein
MISGVARAIALPVAGLVLCLWLLAEIVKWQRRRLLDGQSGIDSIRDLSWQEFEYLVGEAYRRQGFVVQETGSPSGDGGIDLLLTRGPERVLVQCKQWKKRRVGVKPVRELYGVMVSEGASKAILITSGSFTPEARRFAEKSAVVLIEGPELSRMVSTVKTSRSSPENGRIEAGARTPVPVPTESSRLSAEVAPECPKCGAAMVLREARKGPNAGSRFWGCSRFPQCRGTKEADAGGQSV